MLGIVKFAVISFLASSEARKYEFPHEESLKRCLEEHPLTGRNVLSDPKYVSVIAETFAGTSQEKVDFGVVMALSDLNKKEMNLPPMIIKAMGINFIDALKDCNSKVELP